MLYHVEGIVVRSTDYGESHKIIVVYTKEGGKISLMARGARKLKSRLAALSQLLTYAEYTYYRGQSGQMGTLNQGEIIDSHRELFADLQKTAYASYLAEMADRLTEENDGSSYVFSQLAAGIGAIAQGKDGQIIAHAFELLMLSVAGYTPIVDACVSCGSEQLGDEPYSFRIDLGGAVCRRCFSHAGGTTSIVRVSGRTQRLIRMLQSLDLRRLGHVQVSPQSKRELKALLSAFMDYHVNIRWRSRRFIEDLERLPPTE